MKKISALLLMLAFYSVAFCKPVPVGTAQLVGKNFLTSYTSSPAFNSGIQLELIYSSQSAASHAHSAATPPNYFFIFNVKNGDGFVIVAADDNATPILGYSDESDFTPQNIAPHIAKWLEGYKNQMRYIIDNKLPQTDKIKESWLSLKGPQSGSSTIAASVAPLVQTKWDQSPYYNATCPYDNTASERTVTGCVATAMAQVMKYWNYPASGTSHHSYNHSKYGTLSANFGSTNYNWGAMPNRVTSSNSAVATLMYQCGVSVDMNYDVAANGGSGAYVINSQSPVQHCTEYALKTYFGYKTTLKGVERANYSQTQWLNVIKDELNAGRPVIYAGFGSGGGHCFVNDGYDNNDFLHFNWGWDGAFDGYFSVNALNPGGVGTGGGTGGFNSGHQAVIGIEPPSGGATTLDMRLFSNMVASPSPLKYNQAFDVTVDVANFGTSSAQNFSGDYTVAVFNANNDYVATVDTKTGWSLEFNKHYTNPLVFSTTGLSELTPGDYTLGIYYKPTGGTKWIAFADGNFKNFITVTVEGNNTNPLKLYAKVTTTPTVIVRNQTFTVTFDIANYSTTNTFTGDVSVDIHKSDGTWIRELDVKQGLSLPPNSHFTNGLTYTITGGIADAAGTYQLFIWDKPNGGSWEFLGNGAFANPITIQVVEPGLTPDIYEVNNQATQAYNMPVSFSGNTANIKTTGSNCHKGNDYDYYKIDLPTGADYTILARINDSHNSGNGQTYTLDGLVSYSTDGTNWSDAYDDVISNTIQANNGGTIFFFVSPYFTGETGTYLLDIEVTRAKTLSTEKDITGFTVPGIIGNATISPLTASVKLDVSATTDVTALIPTITISNNATINPPSGAVRNFTNPVNYTVTAQDGSTKIWTVTVTKKSGVGMEEIALADLINVYPNPASTDININFESFGGTVNTITLMSMEGKTMLTDNAINGKNHTMDITALKAGVYLLSIQTDKGNITQKVLID